MPFPLGGDFPRSVTRAFKIIKADKRVCDNDNGTVICDAGHKLKSPGTCLNQAIGTFNSTDPSFQPTFPVCTVDYVSSGFNSGILVTSGPHEGGGVIASKAPGDTSDHSLYQLSSAITGAALVQKITDTVTMSAVIGGVSSLYNMSTFFQAVENEPSSYFKVGQFRPGVIPHIPNVFSDLFEYDIVATVPIYSRQTYYALEATTPGIRQSSQPSLTHNLSHYTATISGSEDICKGDEAPPIITYIDPTASGTVVRPTNQVVEFTLSDAPGGVDLSSVYITLNSTASGIFPLVAAGADQTGGRVSITGDSTSYRFRYVPNFTWAYNDRVVVAISGSDSAPLLNGSPFYCGSAGVNTFLGDITFKVHTPENLGASISVIGDVAPPYIVSTSPASGTLSNSVFAPVSIVLADSLTGINLGSITIVVDSTTIVLNGVAQSSEVSITGLPSSYTITYNKTTAFSYGSTVNVSVYAEDRNKPSANVLSTTYSFSCIDDGSMRIENFYPPVGTSVNPETFDIEVDVLDDTYGIDQDQSFLVINGSIVNANVTTITSGIHFTYHPPNDFAYDRPIVVKVHGVNDNPGAPVVKENIYTLYYGNRILFHNNGSVFGHDQTVDVFVFARNNETFHKDLSTGYLFTSYTQPSSDLGAVIQVITPYEDIEGSITAQGPEHRYGQTVTVTFYGEDYEGHALGPYTFTYTIEEEP